MAEGQRVFADHHYAYAVLPDIYRVVHGSGIKRNQVNITPTGISADAWVMGHYLNDYATSEATIVMTSVPQPDIPQGSGTAGVGSNMYTQPYPEFAGQWTTQSGYPSRTVSDVASPEFISSPRFLISFAGSNPEKVLVVPITGAILGVRYATTWSPSLSSTTEVTDLETVRII